ncbi:hypothetical protein GPECTOR_125g504 [Gonium pectorale]|uniref:Uncharacterized protein n=1 Tax=Gonium pectorale TaxID=33097 RepID=A0A150FYI5_GONPE|nr:hypothetical protein GPECTOR_125g504 [Gonium pectorale]|eukprot:KXZ42671.1 hypothetical protein GPECTOR_125g504 [Gonium pectorale]
MTNKQWSTNGAETQPSRVWPELPMELAERIVGCLDRNEVATNFRLVCRAAAAHFSGLQHTTIRLSQPVPPPVFAAHWLAPGATRGLTLARRETLLCLVAASGCVANLEVALRATGRLLSHRVFEAAAASGQLASCQWLLENSCPTSDFDAYSTLLAVAGGGGHRHVCEWLLGLVGLSWWSDGARTAASAGHWSLAEWLLERQPQMNLRQGRKALPTERHHLISAAARVCDLHALRRVVQEQGGWGPAADDEDRADAVAAAAGSPTPDWAAKVEWLEAQGCPKSERAAAEAAAFTPAATVGPSATATTGPSSRGVDGEDAQAEAVARLAWLRARGYPLGRAVEAAAARGNVAALRYLLETAGVGLGGFYAAEAAATRGHAAALRYLVVAGAAGGSTAADGAAAAVAEGYLRQREEWGEDESALLAAKAGHLEAVQVLVSAGRLADDDVPRACCAAARGGHLHVLAWLLGERGAGATAGSVRLDAELFAAAAESGSVELLAWLRERGCGWDRAALPAAAKAGCEEVLEWLVSRGCPLRGSPAAYIAACRNGDLATLRCLRRLGCPWGRAGAVVTAAVSSSKRPPAILRWLLQAGCPVDFAAARAAVERWRGLDPRAAEATLAVLQEHEQ